MPTGVYIRTERYRKLMSLVKKGHPPTNLGGYHRKHSEKTIAKMRKAKLGKTYEEIMGEEKAKRRRAEVKLQMSMESNPNWQGGISFEEYGIEFNKSKKERIRKRDNFRCQECFRSQDELYNKNGKKYKLLIHHIDYNKKNNEDDNLISLCRPCHLQTNYKRKDWTNYFRVRVL